MGLAQVVCGDGIDRARPLARRWLRYRLGYRLRYRRCYERQSNSHPASYPTNVACNSPDTVSHLVSISLESQRLRTLLKVHPIELHAKLLRAR